MPEDRRLSGEEGWRTPSSLPTPSPTTPTVGRAKRKQPSGKRGARVPIGYKICERQGATLRSYGVKGTAIVTYTPGVWTRGIGGTPLFLFRSLRTAKAVTANYHRTLLRELELWECEYLPSSRPLPKGVIPEPSFKETVVSFWRSKVHYGALVKPHSGTILARQVRLLRRIM